MKRKPQRANPRERSISTTRTRIVLMIVIGLAAAAASIALLRYLMAVAYAALMRTNTGPSDWMIAPVVATILTLVLFPYRGVKRLPRASAAAVALIAAIATAFAVRPSEPAVAASHVSVLLALCAFTVAIVLKAMWATIAFHVPTKEELAAGMASTAVEVAVGVVFGALGAAAGGTAGSSSGDGLTAGGGSFGGGGSSGSW